MAENETEDFKEELKSMKEEMAELKEMLKKKAKEAREDDNVNIGSDRRFASISVDGEDFAFDGVDETLGNYFGSVMQGVAENLSSSMKQMATGFQFNIKHDLERVKHELEKNKHNIEKEIHRAGKEAKRAAKEMEKVMGNRHIIHFQKLSEEELEEFYKQAPNLTSALSDEKKLQLLKGLERGPQYQKDLSESTEIKGGTFKHHMDALLDVKYVAQEAVRGRYMITQLGVEALKLSEMLFRRYIFVTNEDAKQRVVDVKVDMDGVDQDISDDADAVRDIQNDEEEG